MRLPSTAAALAAACATLGLLAGCGSSSSSTTTPAQPGTAVRTTSSTTTAHTTTTRSSTSSLTTSTQTRSTSTSQTTTATSTTTPASVTTTTTTTATTRTQTGPAFVGPNPTSPTAVGHDLAAAIAVLAHAGYAPVSTATYHPGNTLRLLVGAKTVAGAQRERVFFFDQTIYLGTDARTASEQVAVLSQSDTEAVVDYSLYSAGTSTPSRHRAVHFVLDMGMLTALDAIPSAASRR
jgi:hypothetical protein